MSQHHNERALRRKLNIKKKLIFFFYNQDLELVAQNGFSVPTKREVKMVGFGQVLFSVHNNAKKKLRSISS